MAAVRAATFLLVLALAALLQATVLARIPFPGATPDLVLLVVVGVGLAGGPVPGSVAGFTGGLLMDLMPPMDGTIGGWALVLTGVGWLAGRAQAASERSVFMPLLVVAALAPAAFLGYTALNLLMGNPRVETGALLSAVAAVTLYDVLLAPFLVPVTARLYRRLSHTAAAY